MWQAWKSGELLVERLMCKDVIVWLNERSIRGAVLKYHKYDPADVRCKYEKCINSRIKPPDKFDYCAYHQGWVDAMSYLADISRNLRK